MGVHVHLSSEFRVVVMPILQRRKLRPTRLKEPALRAPCQLVIGLRPPSEHHASSRWGSGSEGDTNTQGFEPSTRLTVGHHECHHDQR